MDDEAKGDGEALSRMILAIKVQRELQMPFCLVRCLILPRAQHTSSTLRSFGRGKRFTAVMGARRGTANRQAYLLFA